jgi:hypothetical protein
MPKTKSSTKPTKRGMRGPEARAIRRAIHMGNQDEKKSQKLQAAVERGMCAYWITANHILLSFHPDTHRIEELPTTFYRAKPDGAAVRKALSNDPEQLTALPTTGKVQVPLRDLPDRIKVPGGLPPHLIIRFDRFISKADQKRLRKRWDDVLASGALHHSGKHANRSTNDTAFHFGIWEVTASKPYLTAETRHQTPEAIKAIDALLKYIGDFVAGKIGSVFETHAPQQWEAMQR